VDRQVPMICEYHYSVRIYLEELYKDYHGPGEVNNFTLLDLAFLLFPNAGIYQTSFRH
jgi:hypothetical protein